MDSKLTEKEVIEITFMIYVPQGSNLRLEDTRKSTWLNPLVDGKEAKKLMGKRLILNVIIIIIICFYIALVTPVGLLKALPTSLLPLQPISRNARTNPISG